MSHEMRTPLTAVIGMAEVLLNTSLSERQQECVDAIAFSGGALLQLVNDILDFSKLQADKLTLESVVFNIRECVEHSAQVVQLKADEKKLELILLVKSDVPSEAVGDPCRIRQVLFNLLSNAVKFTSKGHILVKCWISVDHRDLFFEVEDTGLGLSSFTMSKLFQPFTQADTSTTRKFGGTGLGLAICKQLVERMGGELHVSSNGEGHGSTFHFSIPFVHPSSIDHKDRAVTFAGTAMTPQMDEGRRTSQQSYCRSAGLDSILARRHCILIADPNELRRGAALELLRSMDMPCGDLESGLVEGPALVSVAGMLSEVILAYWAETTSTNLDPYLDKLRNTGTTNGAGSRPIILVTNVNNAIPDSLAEGLVCTSKPLTRQKVLYALAKLLLPANSRGAQQHSPHGSAAGGAAFGSEVHTNTEVTPRSGISSRHSPRHMAPDFEVRFSNMKVLVVDDVVLNQRVITLKLQQGGFGPIDTASSGSEALLRIRSSSVVYDIVLMDVSMPGMDGIEATRAIKLDARYRTIPIIGITGNCMPEEIDECLNAGMIAVLAKPINTTEMFDVLKGLLETPSPERQLSSDDMRRFTGSSANNDRFSSLAVIEPPAHPAAVAKFKLAQQQSNKSSTSSVFSSSSSRATAAAASHLQQQCEHPCAVNSSFSKP